MEPETHYDSVANVGLKDGLIAVITKEKIEGDTSIDASNLVVAPGFIDTHFHWTRPTGYKLALREDVTTARDLEAAAIGPLVGECYAMHEGRSQVNFGTASGHELARTKVMQNLPDEGLLDAPYSVVKGRAFGTAWFEKVADLEEGKQMLSLVDEGSRLSALGVASTVGCIPGATARSKSDDLTYRRPARASLCPPPGVVLHPPGAGRQRSI